MKLSLVWLFDHLFASWTEYPINELVERCNTTVAEIDSVTHVTIALRDLSLARITDCVEDRTVCYSPEWRKELAMPTRPDGVPGQSYLIKKAGEVYQWALLSDIASSKEGFVPALHVDDMAMEGGWKEYAEEEDYILEIDNKSITHRPDLWCHRGFAREFGAMLDLPVRPEEFFLYDASVQEHDTFAAAHGGNPLRLELQERSVCKRFAGIYFSDVLVRPSPLLWAMRLAKVDARPINALVDATNIAMLDMSQPMHVFDAAKLQGGVLMQRKARAGEPLTLLDGQIIELTEHDLVVADAKRPVSLAGVMGGKETGVTASTTEVLLEAAAYDGPAIRAAATRHKLRTESSARFEKSLNPQLNLVGIQRFLKLLEEQNIGIGTDHAIQSLGNVFRFAHIQINHAFIEQRLGVQLYTDWVVKTLQVLGFTVKHEEGATGVCYRVTPPLFRGCNDVTEPEDVLEELGRMYGFANIEPVMPALPLEPREHTQLVAINHIKSYLAFAGRMREVNNYAFFDEQFLPKLAWPPIHAVGIANPVSQHWRRLVTSLIPHLFKGIEYNKSTDSVRFFELNRVWQQTESAKIQEQLHAAGLLFEKQEPFNFYNGKALLDGLFDELLLDVVWEKAQLLPATWYHPFQTARLVCNGIALGYAGKIDPGFLHPFSEGDAFLFELDVDAVRMAPKRRRRFKPLPKYPDSILDVSMLVPREITVDQIKTVITNTDERVVEVDLIDMFEKVEWHDQKSLTFRVCARDLNKTMDSTEIQALLKSMEYQLKRIGAIIR